MTELALILGIQAVALTYAVFAGRSVFAIGGYGQRLRQMEGALSRATSSFMGRQARVVLLGAVAVAALVFLVQVKGARPSQLGATVGGLISALGVLLGALLALGCSSLTLQLNLRAGIRLVHSVGFGMDRALRAAVRAGAAGAIVCEVASLSGLLLTSGAVFALAGGTTIPRGEALGLIREVITLLTGFPLGAALATIVLQRASGTYHAASELGADLAYAPEVGVGPSDPRNPALVSSVAGDHLSDGAARAALIFSMASAANVAVMALGLAAAEQHALPTLALPFLPLIARSFFLLGSLFAFSAVRTEELTNPTRAIVRGHVSATLIGLSGVLGACFWLAREQFTYLFAAGAAASLTAAAVALPVWAQLLRREAWRQEAREPLHGTPNSPALSGLIAGLEAALLPTLALGLGAALVWRLGQMSSLPSGGLWASLVGWASLLGAAPFAFAASSVPTLADTARAGASLAGIDPEALRRSERLGETYLAAAGARAQLIAAGIGTALLAALAIPGLGGAPKALNIALLEPTVTWSGALGVALVLAYAGSCTRAALMGAREVAAEVERQLRDAPRDPGSARFPANFTPSYKVCVDLSARSALRRLWLYAFSALSLQALIGIGLHLSFRMTPEPIALRAVTSFVLFAAITGFVAAFALDATRATLSLVRRLGRSGLASGDRPFAPSAGIAGLLGNSAGPAAQTLVVATASVGLSLAPFLRS